jgi:hypothetical protein
MRRFAIFLLCLTFVGCEIRSTPALITVYSPTLEVSFPLPQGWTADAALEQAGFHMQTFTGRSVDVPERPGIRLQILAGPMPDGPLDLVSERFRRELNEERVEEYKFEDFVGKTWYYVSDDEEERARLMLIDVDDRLYGLYLRGEARTLEAYDSAIERLWSEFSIEKGPYFEVYKTPDGEISIPHPRSWTRTQAMAEGGESFFVGFRSTPLAVERDGTTVHATLEVTVHRVADDLTVERFYAARTEQLGDNYRLLSHHSLDDLGAISTLYLVETQLANYLERTVYYVSDGKSFIFKFNARNQIYHAIEPWIDEIIASFFGVDRAKIEMES